MRRVSAFPRDILTRSPRDIQQAIVALEEVPLEEIVRNIFTCMSVTYKTGFGLDNWIY
jgi:hypothetical protein